MTALSLDAEGTPAGWLYANLRLLCRYSSVVEHTLGKGGVVSPILTSGTIFKNAPFEVLFLYVFQALQRVRFAQFLKEQILTTYRTFSIETTCFQYLIII